MDDGSKEECIGAVAFNSGGQFVAVQGNVKLVSHADSKNYSSTTQSKCSARGYYSTLKSSAEFYDLKNNIM
jgi:hypothetical protein